MKKLYYSVVALAMSALLPSCAEKDFEPVGSARVTFAVVAPGPAQTKAIVDGECTVGNGQNTDSLYYEIYDRVLNENNEWEHTKLLGEGKAKGSLDAEGRMTFIVDMNLVIDQYYRIVFWAHVDGGSKYYDVSDLIEVKVRNNYYKFEANDESRAAFYAKHDFQALATGERQNVLLTRPFAQLNMGTVTLESSLTEDIYVDSTTVEISGLANVFNTVESRGYVSAETTEGYSVRFKAVETPNGADDMSGKYLKVANPADPNGGEYHWIGMNYLIPCDGLFDVDVEIFTNAGKVEHSVPSVPLKENYRTNLIGNFLTTGVTFDIVVDEAFEPEDENRYI